MFFLSFNFIRSVNHRSYFLNPIFIDSVNIGVYLVVAYLERTFSALNYFYRFSTFLACKLVCKLCKLALYIIIYLGLRKCLICLTIALTIINIGIYKRRKLNHHVFVLEVFSDLGIT